MDICILSNVEGLLFLLAPVPFWMLCLWSISLSLVNQRPVNLKKMDKMAPQMFYLKARGRTSFKTYIFSNIQSPRKVVRITQTKSTCIYLFFTSYASQFTHYISSPALITLYSRFTHKWMHCGKSAQSSYGDKWKLTRLCSYCSTRWSDRSPAMVLLEIYRSQVREKLNNAFEWNNAVSSIIKALG